MKHIQLSSLHQSYSQCQVDRPGHVWAVGLQLDGVPFELMDDLSEQCKKWVGWGFYTNEAYDAPYLLFESKEEAFMAMLSLETASSDDLKWIS
jgi:hypothetical protein